MGIKNSYLDMIDFLSGPEWIPSSYRGKLTLTDRNGFSKEVYISDHPIGKGYIPDYLLKAIEHFQMIKLPSLKHVDEDCDENMFQKYSGFLPKSL